MPVAHAPSGPFPPDPSSSPGFGEHPHCISTCELGAVTSLPAAPTSSRGLRPPRPRRAPSSTWPPLPRLRSPPDAPAPRAPQLRAHPSQLPPHRPPSPGGGGPERALAWPMGARLTLASPPRGRQSWRAVVVILWSGVWMPPLPRVGTARRGGCQGISGRGREEAVAAVAAAAAETACGGS